MSGGETAWFTVRIGLTTEGELPTDSEVENLIYDQMAGQLDDDGLEVLSAEVISRSAEGF